VRLLQAFLDIEVPVISAINGPVVTHSETPLLADVVLAAEHTVFHDATHFLHGLPPGDGMHTIWTTLLGLNRGRHFLLTGRVLTAQEALDYGVVSEVLPQQELLPRAWELATRWASYSPAALHGTRAALTLEWRRLLHEQLDTGLTHEAFAGAFAGASDPATPIVDLDPRR
jgi:enoyl-CoA hydratase/carnithine racemase